MKSPQKYKENGTNCNLLLSMVQKLPILRRKNLKNESCKSEFYLDFCKKWEFELFISQNKSPSTVNRRRFWLVSVFFVFTGIPFRMNFLKIDLQGGSFLWFLASEPA
jgi:hypothetical protein